MCELFARRENKTEEAGFTERSFFPFFFLLGSPDVLIVSVNRFFSLCLGKRASVSQEQMVKTSLRPTRRRVPTIEYMLHRLSEFLLHEDAHGCYLREL